MFQHILFWKGSGSAHWRDLLTLMHIGATSPSPDKVSIPFPVLAGLDEVVRHPGWVQAFAAVRAGLAAGTPVVLAGQPGLGKSLLLKVLAHTLEQEGQTVVLLPGSNQVQDRQPDVVLLDEADRVPRTLLQHLVSGAPGCVLVGPRTLLDSLHGLAAARTLVELRPLSPEEVGPYLSEQIGRAGLPDALLGPGTFEALAQAGNGNPRRLQKLASRALFRAWMDNADQVSATHVAEAIAQDGAADASAPAELPQPSRDPVAAPASPQLAPPTASLPLAPRRAVPGWAGPGVLRPRIMVAGGAAVLGLALAALAVWPRGGPALVAAPPPPALATDAGPPADRQTAALAAPAAPEPEPGAAPLPPAAGAAPEEAGNGATPPEAPSVPPAASPDLAGSSLPQQPGPTPPDTVAEATVPAPVPVVVPVPEPPPAPAALPRQALAVPVLPAVPPSLPRPAVAPVHVVVAFPPSAVAAGVRGVSLVAALKEAGMDAVLEVGPVGEQTASVRYFYAADRGAAARVARQMGEAPPEQPATIRGALPRPGTIQVVIPPRPPAGKPLTFNKVSQEKKVL